MKELSLLSCRLDKRYDIHERLGRGSYAEIYLARDIIASPHSTHSSVVIKALNVFLQDDLDDDLERTLVENFQNEALALDRVRHPNVISRLGHGTARDLQGTVFHYLVLEYLPGGDLHELMRNEKLDLARAFKYIEQVCAGLAHAHERGIIHRDIKPQNLLLTADKNTVKIADFGVARVNISDSPITRVGTNIYAPPEHSPLNTGKTGDLRTARITPSSDIYSLAKTIYTLVCGESPRPYANHTITDLPARVKGESWSSDLLRVLQRATQDDAGARHQSIDQFWNDLASIRQWILDEGPSTVVGSAVTPQPHVSRGYSPIAPDRPTFKTDPDQPLAYAPPVRPTGQLDLAATTPEKPGSRRRPDDELPPGIVAYTAPKRRSLLRKVATFIIAIGIFTGLLYGTATYMKGRGFLPSIPDLFAGERTAVANRDVYLRQGPSPDNDQVGLVTKNSKLKIVNSKDNWYQVDVVEQGRARPQSANSATRGWLNGKYVDINQN